MEMSAKKTSFKSSQKPHTFPSGPGYLSSSAFGMANPSFKAILTMSGKAFSQVRLTDMVDMLLGMGWNFQPSSGIQQWCVC